MSVQDLYNEIKGKKGKGTPDLLMPNLGTSNTTRAVPTRGTTPPSIHNLPKTVVQGTSRGFYTLGQLGAGAFMGMSPDEVAKYQYQPKGYGKLILGKEPVGLKSEGSDLLTALGVDEKYANELGVFTVAGFAALDVSTGGTTSGFRQAFKQLAKEKSKEVTEQIIRNTFKDISDPAVVKPLSNLLSKVEDPGEVERIVLHVLNQERAKTPVTTRYWYDNPPKPKSDEVVVSFVDTGGDLQYVNTNLKNQAQYEGKPQFGVVKKSELVDTGDINKTKDGVFTIPRALANKVVMENTVTDELRRVPIRTPDGKFAGSRMEKPATTGKPDSEYKTWLKNQPEARRLATAALKKAQTIADPLERKRYIDNVTRAINTKFVEEYKIKVAPQGRTSFMEDGILFDRTLKEVQDRLKTIFGREVPIRVTENTKILGGDDFTKVYGRGRGDTIFLLRNNKTFSEAVANHEGWHWFLRNLSDTKRKELESLQKELYDSRPDLRAQVEKDYDVTEYTPEQIAEEMMAEEFARFTKTGRTFSEKAKIFFDNAVEALLRVFKVRDDVMSRVEGEFSKVKKTLNEDGMKGKGTSAKKQIEQKNLLAVHNLSEVKLRFADRVGGLANPSVAVINPKITGFESYGDISLIGDRSLIEGQKTHLADAYSPRFPSVHSTMGWNDFKQLEKDLQPLYDEIGEDAKKVAFDDTDMIRYIENNPAVALKFLKERKIKPVTGGQHYYINQINKLGLGDKYQDFLDDLYKKYNLEEQMFAGYTNAGKRRYKPLSVGEASKIMSKQKEEGFNYGLGSFRSKVAPVKRKVSDIRKQQGRLVSKEEFDVVKESYDKELWTLKDELEPYARKYDSNSFVESDMQINMIGNVLTGEDVGMSAFKAKYPNVPDELVSKVLKFRDKLKEMPTEYFETKFKRPVDISEFRIALVPKNISPQAREILENKGLRVETYREGEKQEVMKRLLNEDVAFKQVSQVDRLIAEGKIRVVSRNGRDVYQTKQGNQWVNRRDEDSALKSLEPKPKAPSKAIEVAPELEERLLAAQIAQEALGENPLKQLTKFAAKTGQERGTLREVTGKTKGKFANEGDVLVDSEDFKNAGIENTEQAREAFAVYRERAAAVEVELKEAKEAIKLAKLEQKARQGESKAISELTEPVYQPVRGTPEAIRTLENQAQEALGAVEFLPNQKPLSLKEIITQTPLAAKVNILDYMRTPDRVLKKIGFEKEAKLLRDGYDKYIVELPKNIEKVTKWFDRVPKDSGQRIFQYLDGQDVKLAGEELKVAGEIKVYLKEWADRLNLPEDNRVTNYITHLFDDQLIAKEFDEDLAKLITDKIPGQVYNPFLEKRLGAKGYKQDVWQALDAYTKRATRKANMDDALTKIQDKAGSSLEFSNLEKSQFDYIQKYVSRVNMRPTEIDNLIDNSIKQLFGYRAGQRPVARISQFMRRLTYRSFLGLNLGSALRNLSQGINTYAVLGERDTALGYMKLFSAENRKELAEQGILANNFIQDRTINATRKLIEKGDKAIWVFFDTAEKINRGSAYLGAKSKAIRQGKSEQEAIDYAKSIVRKTQFNYDAVDTPVALASDIVKTLLQFQTYTTKQTEFLTELAKDKNFLAFARYALAGYGFVYTIGQAFGMEPKELLPINTDTWSRFELAPSLKIPKEIAKALMNTPDDYGSERDLEQKMSDVAKTLWGLVPGGAQLKKTIGGMEALEQGGSIDKAGRQQFEVGGTPAKDTQAILFGKYANEEAKQYFDKETGDEAFDKLKEEDAKAKKEDRNRLREDVNSLKGASKAEIKAKLLELAKEDEKYAEKVLDALVEEKLGLTPNEKKLKEASVKVRANYIKTRMEDMDKEEKKAYLKDLTSKGILTEAVLDELLKE